jgi:hypothetical protein
MLHLKLEADKLMIHQIAACILELNEFIHKND